LEKGKGVGVAEVVPIHPLLAPFLEGEMLDEPTEFPDHLEIYIE